ncbi:MULTISPECIES: nucleoside triphosphate pyrophosphatase [unclassified Curtobacterium]|uniref:Maf family protein n=1 Tax=unclassified Curtobacterium TaxID=257496 RepID=UPI0008DCFCF4|nr:MULTISPECIES: Maf family protein [unclassified Curtobacterium]OIH92182.1 septum formation inhibitor Maf [Curtobacterium sp. MCBA15_003]OII10461.1 septum formation inhibitor Maf [Curtobacterium sp. MCBA15_009]OII30161.1 septum formation inhibitor Maf [Curtobacterium sp. MMLR14_006]
MRLYLASTSPARRALLAQSGIEPVLVSPGVDEDAAGAAAAASLGRDLTGPELVSLLAVAKASAVADAAVAGSPVDGVVFGGDSAFEVDGRLYGKPHDPAVARERWRQMLAAGGGTLWSGHCVVDRRRDVDPATGRTGGPDAARTVPPVRPLVTSPAGVPDLGDVAPGGSALAAAGDRVVAVDSAVLTFADDVSADEIDAYVATGEPLEVAGAFTIDGRAAAYITRIDGAPSAVIGMSLPMLRTMLLRGFGIDWHDLWSL